MLKILQSTNFKKYWFIIFYLIIYFFIINLVSLNRFWQFENFYFDHGIYDGSVWQAANFKIPFFDHIDNSRLMQLGDHFSPFMYIFSIIYFFTSAYEPILVIQNLLFVLSAYILFITAKRHTGNKLMLFALILSYTLFIGAQNALITGFRPEFAGIFFLSLALYFLDRKKWIFYWICLIITLGFKETFVGIGLGLGLYLVLIKEFKQGFFTIAYSFFYYFLTIKFFIPLVSGGSFLYSFTSYSLPKMIEQFFYPFIKLETISISFLTYGTLPLFGLNFLPAILQDFFGRFVLNAGHARWDLGMHYNAMLNPLLFYGSLIGLDFLQKRGWYKKVISWHAIALIIIVLFFHRFAYHGPLGLVSNFDFYKNTKNSDFLREFISKIPDGKKLMTMNNLAPYLTHSNEVMLLRPNYSQWMPEIIAIDIRSGQNANNYWPLNGWQSFSELYQRLLIDPNYRLKEITKEQVLFIKENKINEDYYKLPQK